MKSKLMKNKLTGLLAVYAALFLVFALAGCPQAHEDLWTLEEALVEDPSIIQAEIGTPSGSVRAEAKGSGTVGTAMNELNPEGDGSTNYFTLTLPDSVAKNTYVIKFRYASGNDNFGVKFTVNGGDVQTTGTVGKSDTSFNNGWDLGTTFDLAESDPVELKAGDELKIWTTDWGCIDFIKLEEDKTIIIQAETGTPSGSVKAEAKGSGTVGTAMNELGEGDGTTDYFTLTLPGNVPNGSYIVKFRYASGMDNFGVNFTVNGGATQTTGEVGSSGNNGWDLTDTHNFADSTAPVVLKGGDVLKIWSITYGCIDYIKLEPAN
jgi:hypothetical protein